MSRLYHEGSRRLQDAADSRRIADRLEERSCRSRFTASDRELIESAPMFFLATADAEGRPDVSYKGGMPGFVRVVADNALEWPDYDGNGMFRSLGNVLVNPRVGLLFVAWADPPRRLRVQGAAAVREEGGGLVVAVEADAIFPNCPRYIHRMELVEHSVYAPRPGHVPPEPAWKRDPAYRDALPGSP